MPSDNDTKRLQKAEADDIAKALKDVGFTTQKSGDHIHFYKQAHGRSRWLGCFMWESSRKGRSGGWQLYMVVSPIYTVRDLAAALSEIKRVSSWLFKAEEAWKAFASSKSRARWLRYRGYIAALFTKQEPPE